MMCSYMIAFNPKYSNSQTSSEIITSDLAQLRHKNSLHSSNDTNIRPELILETNTNRYRQIQNPDKNRRSSCTPDLRVRYL